MTSPSYDEQVCAMFDAFCKRASVNYIEDLRRAERRRTKNYPCEPVEYLFELLGHVDTYPSDSFMLYADGRECAVKSETLYNALSSLPERQRDVLLLGFWHSLTDGEIAEMMEVTTRTVYNLRQRAFRAIKEYYGKKRTDKAAYFGADRKGGGRRPGGSGSDTADL